MRLSGVSAPPMLYCVKYDVHKINSICVHFCSLQIFKFTVYDPPSFAIKEFVTKKSRDICCVRCNRVPRKPLRLVCCDTLYCEPCAVSVTRCPKHGSRAEYKTDLTLKGKISKSTVVCSNAGCNAKCAVYQMRDHLASCTGRKCK